MTDEEWAITAKLEASTRDRVRQWMNARDCNIALHCERVAAKYQRWIIRELENNGIHNYGTTKSG